MSDYIVAILGFVAMFALIALGMRIAFALVITGLIGILLMTGSFGAGLSSVGFQAIYSVQNVALICIPMFVLTGQLLGSSGMASELYTAAQKWVGRLRGGLGIATVGACALFGAATGSSVATAAAFGRVAVPEMMRFGYSKKLASGTVAAAGTLASLIPPSVALALYGIVTETSIGKLLVAGIIPGISQAIVYCILILVMSRFGWARHVGETRFADVSWRERLASLPTTFPFVALFVVVMGGIYFGIMTASEAAAIGGLACVIILLAMRRLRLGMLREAFSESVFTTVMMFAIFMGAIMFGQFLTVTRAAADIQAFLTTLEAPRYLILTFIVVLFLILGCVMDVGAMIMIFLPFLFPVIKELGFDPIWFGVVTVRVMEVGMITPPIGMNAYVLKGVVPELALEDVFRGILPFIIADFVNIGILIAVPQISLFLPNTIR